MNPQNSELLLEIRLPAEDGHPVSFVSADGLEWKHTPGKLLDEYQTGALWEKIDQNWLNGRGLLSKTGAALGQWLFNERAALYLSEKVSAWSDAQPRLRIELRVPQNRVEYPWEIASLEGINHLAVHPALTVIRISSRGVQQLGPPTSQLVCHVVGVEHQQQADWAPLKTAQEVETIRQEIEHASIRGRFVVALNTRGDWSELVETYRESGPPHIFHFAGHGLAQGRGLVFRGKDGKPEEIMAEQIAQVLASRRKGRQTRLVFLNACTTTAAGKGPFQPFGGVGDLLIQHGIPVVVGLQTPVEDKEATALAAAFYAALSRGYMVDCAIQEAREKLFLLASNGVGWAFLNLIVSGQPDLLCQVSRQSQIELASELLMAFGHEIQRQRLERFLLRKNPMVVVVHGEERSGQRHVLKRVQFDLERAGNILWRPVATLHLHMAGDPLLQRIQLAGGIARALSVVDTGTQESLENRLAQTIADRCPDGQVLVIDLQEELKFQNAQQAHAILTLIQDLWVDLMVKAAAYRSTLPVFLLVSVAYPKPLPESHPKATRSSQMSELTKQTVEQLQAKTRLKGNVRVEVLPKLEPFDESYVTGFLEDVLELDPDSAESKAAYLVGLNDNEAILEGLAHFLSEWEEK